MAVGATVVIMSNPNAAAESPDAGALTPEFIENLRDGYEMNEGDRARFNAVTNADINALADIIEKVADLSIYLIEDGCQLDINPIVWDGKQWMALDVKVVI